MTKWLPYGANGCTGELIAREARRQGLAPVLAGRNLTPVKLLAEDFGLEHRIFDLRDADAQLSDVDVVLHCAGPFSTVKGPDVQERATSSAHVGGETTNTTGQRLTARITTANPYRLTIDGALTAVTELLAAPTAHRGAHTPATLFGADLITRLPGSGPLTITTLHETEGTPT